MRHKIIRLSRRYPLLSEQDIATATGLSKQRVGQVIPADLKKHRAAFKTTLLKRLKKTL